MALNKSSGNMYDFVTHTWNPIKGKCLHECSYCYMKKWGEQKEVHIVEKEFIDLGANKFIFVGSSTDIFADNIPDNWIDKVLDHCNVYLNNYLFQTKNPDRISRFNQSLHEGLDVICTTLETNRIYPKIMMNSPSIENRVHGMSKLTGFRKFITIEPILDFDLSEFVESIKRCDLSK